MIFKAKVKPKKGPVIVVELHADDIQSAKRLAERQGVVLSINRSFGVEFKSAMTQEERSIFFSRLSAMLSSRVGTSDALRLMRDTFTGHIREVSAKLLSFVEQGDDLAGAIKKVGSPHFPEATVALIEAGSKSGETWRSIREASIFEKELESARKAASKGLWMGIAGFLTAGAVLAASVLYIGPMMMGDGLIGGNILPEDQLIMDQVNKAANILSYVMIFFFCIGLAFMFFGSVVRRIIPVQADAIILKIPYYKDLILAKNNFIVLYGLALLVNSGVRIEEALRLSGQSAPRGALRRDLYAAMSAVRTGRPWAAAMKTLHPTDVAALQSSVDRIQVAQTLNTLAIQYKELYALRLASFVPTLQLISAVFLSGAGGVLFAQAILPMLMASSGILNQ